MKTSLIPVFPGTNCDKETLIWIEDNLETKAEFLDLSKHKNLSSNDLDLIVIPGGFSYGDYLRAGAIAARSEEMKCISKWAQQEVPVLGICNGFQILCESRLLPGTLIKNVTRQHHHFPVAIQLNKQFFQFNSKKSCVWIPKMDPADSPKGSPRDDGVKSSEDKISERYSNFEIPMSCGMGNWRPPLNEIEKKNAYEQAVIYYINNENGSDKSIAGIMNSAGNILGLMPHPERASDSILGSEEGLLFLYGVAKNKKIKIKEGSKLWHYTMSF